MTKVYIDQIAELTAESVKAASLTPLRARESAPLSHREAGRRENANAGRRYHQAICLEDCKQPDGAQRAAPCSPSLCCGVKN